VSLNENIDTSTPMGKAMIGVLAAFAQLERETIMLRTRMGMKERVKSGKWMGGARIPYGYDYDAEKGILVPNENAETVRKVYELYIQGYSAQNIANMLGLKYDKLAEHILKRKTYYGIIPYKDEEYKGLHEPIITKEMYDEAQLCMSKRAANNLTTADHLLTGLVYCGKCNAKMRYQKWGNKGHKLVCYSQQKDKPYLIKDPECSQKKVWAEDVEEEVIKAIFDLKNRQVNTPDIRDNSNLIADLNKQRGDMERKIKNLYSLYADSEDSMLIETINEHKKKLEGINKRIEIEMKQNSLKISRDKLNKTLNSLEIKWEHMDTKEKQIILRSLIEKIVITDDEVEVRLSI
jgi:site-specific DNA recombinase